MPGDFLTVATEARDQVTVLFLEGEADATSAAQLHSALDKAAQRKLPVILDVSRLDYIDSSGFRVVYQASEHTSVSIVVAADAVLSRTVRLAGISTRIPVFPDLDAAMEHAANTGPAPRGARRER